MAKKALSQIEDLQKKIEIAQETVGNMTDPSLKPIAFQTVLQQLLASDEMPSLESKKKVPEPTKVEIKKSKQPIGVKGRVEELIAEGFFAQKRTLEDVKSELDRHGWFHRVTEVSPALLRLIHQRKLRRIKEPENEGGRLVWRYSNW